MQPVVLAPSRDTESLSKSTPVETELVSYDRPKAMKRQAAPAPATRRLILLTKVSTTAMGGDLPCCFERLAALR